ncbi:MAG: PAS domain S-box protein [Deltaproteobacteria bacterium]|nr:PAS domain S-box protein [Deltaproteobacteria bacterium]
MAAPKRSTKRLQILPGGKGSPSPGVAVRTRGVDPEPKSLVFDAGSYEVLFENASDAILVIDLNTGSITSANNAALELTGYLREEIVSKSAEQLFLSSETGMGHSQSLGWAHVESNGFFEDVVLRAKDGYPRYVSLSSKTLALGDSRVAMCILRDVGEKKNMERDLITKHTELREAYVDLEKANAELKAMQETLVQSGKLAALGELAAGIAHELNQPLTAIKGFAQEARSAASSPKGCDTAYVGSCLGEVVQGADKMEKIISHLRNFTRKSTEDFAWVDVHAVIEESLVMLDKQLSARGIKVERGFDATLPKVWCNPFQLEQVFINLATNARDAIEAKASGSGRITIETRAEGDDLVEIRFADDGCGIPDSVKAKIFNPFFTTKEVGKGMGLGLSISYGILSRINASILVESGADRGTTFTIKLPVDYRKH